MTPVRSSSTRRPAASTGRNAKAPSTSNRNAATKTATGIVGFDEITGGGLPRGRTTLLVGGPGSGKTIFGLQFLAHAARESGVPGIFVAFEESPERLVANFEGFGWNLRELQRKSCSFSTRARPPS